MSTIYVEIIATRGSAPRDAGTVMAVTAKAIEGTIGGGALEYRAIDIARRMLDDGIKSRMETVPLGPGLGQCCGGTVTLAFGRTPRPVDGAGAAERDDTSGPDRQSFARGHGSYAQLWLWGAGHVGRAVQRAAPAQMFRITWIDTAPDRFPEDVPPSVTRIPAADMPLLARRAARDAHHLVFTYSHEIDFALCVALIERAPKSIGLIGSQTKWRRFSHRLRQIGLDPNRVTCPIGDKTLGKAPNQIAEGVVRALGPDRWQKRKA